MSQLESIGSKLRAKRQKEALSTLARTTLELIAVTREQNIPPDRIIKLVETHLKKW